MITKYNTYNESVRDMMTPKTREEIMQAFQNSDIKKKREMLFELQKDIFNYTSEFDGFVRKNLDISDWNYIKNKINKNFWFTDELIGVLKKHQLDKLFYILLSKSNLLKESVRDKMTPKSDKEIRDSIKNSGHPTYSLWYACEYDYPDIAEKSLKELWKLYHQEPYMAVTNIIDQSLDLAIKSGSLKIVKLLQKNSANLRYSNDKPIRIACEKGHLDIVKYLVSLGADIHSVDEQCLRNSVYYGYLDITKFLLDNGADLHTWNDYCFRYAGTDEMKKLLNSYKVNESVRDQMTPKSMEEIRNNIGSLHPSEIMDKFINDDDMLRELYTEEEIISMLKQIRPNHYLREFSKNQNYWLVGLMIMNRDLDDFSEVLKYHVLELSILDNNHNITKYLIEKGKLDVNRENGRLMMYAIRFKRDDIVRYLVEKGFNLNLLRMKWCTITDSEYFQEIMREKINESVRDMMTPKPEEDVRKLLMNASDSQKLLMSIQFGYFDMFLEVYNGCRKSIEEDDVTKQMIFMKACSYGNYEVVKFMIDEGIDITYLNNKGLRYAVKGEHWDVVSLLRQNGIKLSNESVRDMMTPRSEEEVIRALKKLSPNDKLRKSCELGIVDGVKDAIEKGAKVRGRVEWGLPGRL